MIDSMSFQELEKNMKGMLKKCELEKRYFTADEERRYNQMEDALTYMEKQRILPLPDWQWKRDEAAAKARKTGGFDDNYRYNPVGTEARDVFNRYILHGSHALHPEEYRRLQADKDVYGGFLVLPTEVSSYVFVDLDNALFVRQLATKIRVPHAETFSVPRLDSDFGNPTWTNELGTGALDESMDYVAVTFTPRPLARRIKISYDLLRLSLLNPEAHVRERMSQVLLQVLENAYLVGEGSAGPLGLFVASDSGISTSRDVTASSTTSFTYDDIVNVVGTLKYQWRQGAAWICSREIETFLRKLKDGMGRPIITDSVDGNYPPRVLGFPLFVSEYAPNTLASGQYAMLLGNLKYYYIVDGMNLSIQRLEELYAETNQLGLIIRYAGDGNVVTENAFVRLKFA